MNKQLIKDIGRLIADTRMGFIDVRSAGTDGVIIGQVSFAWGTGEYTTIARDVAVTYDNILDAVAQILARHPVHAGGARMHSVQYSTKTRSVQLATTNQSNIELYGTRHTRVSRGLATALINNVVYSPCDGIKIVSAYCDGYISYSDRTGGIIFKFTG